MPHASAAAARRLNVAGLVASASAAACAAVLVTNVPETVKTRLQLDGEGAARGGTSRQYRGVAHALATIWRLEGARGLQAGLGAGVAYQAVFNGCRLGLFEPIQRLVRRVLREDDPAALTVTAASGALSGALGAVVGSPLYLVKSRLQAQSAFFHAREAHRYAGLADGLAQVYAAEGLRGLFRGVDGALPRVVIGSATQLTVYDHLRRRLAAEAGLRDTPLFLAASLVTSLVTVTVMNPLDVVSTRLYQSSGVETRYRGPLDCAVQAVRAEGLLALQKGWLAQYARLGPHTILTFVAMEHLRPLLAGVPLFSEAEPGGSLG